MSGHAHRDQAGHKPEVEHQHNAQAVRASHVPQRRAGFCADGLLWPKR